MPPTYPVVTSPDPVGDSDLFGPLGQIAFAALAALAVAVVPARRSRFVSLEAR